VNPVERVPLGRTDVQVTRLGLGLAPLAGLYTAVGEEQAYATVERAWELGIRYFDTAPLYGNGLSERRSGHVLAGKPRAEFTLSTKTGRRLVRSGGGAGQEIWAEATDLAPVWDFTPEGTTRSYAESLDRLGLDRADVLHLHDPDDHYTEAVSGALEREQVLLHRAVLVAVDRDIGEADGLPRPRAARSGDAGDAEADLRLEAQARAARERARDDGRDGAVRMDELRRDVREDLLRLVAVHDRSPAEVIARAAVRGEDRCEQSTGA